MLDPLIIILLLVLGVLFAIIATLVGIGGGLLYVPSLIFLFSIDTINATLISSFVIVFTSSSGFLKYRQQKRIDMKTALIYLSLAIPGSVFGGYAAEQLDGTLLKQIFAILVGISAIRGIRKIYMNSKTVSDSNEREAESTPKLPPNRRIVDIQGEVYEYNIKLNYGMIFAFLGGFIAGLLGVGGGIIFVPLLNVISGVPIHVAVATSTTMIVLVSTIAVITRFTERSLTGELDLELIFSYGIPLALGSIIGAYIGAAKVKDINSEQLKFLFWVVALIASLRMFFG
ncbi:MAG: sulfite exporter TauE/SafE family protein [Candidatus Kariarchaeaceae archaeon]|jgi:uncharacterized membrane protein YfcA